MPSPQETNTIQVYFKIPYTEVTTVVNVKDSLTTVEFMEYVNTYVRNILNINPRDVIELVEAGKPGGELAVHMEPRHDETLLQRYGNTNQTLAFYARPVPRLYFRLNNT